jgi:valyl-tRNA synthetase
LDKVEKQLGGSQARLGDEGVLGKAPAHVVEGLRKQVSEQVTLRDKIVAQLKDLPLS